MSQEEQQQQFAVERLEDRVQLAGDVRALLTGGGLMRITGTNDSNQIMVSNDGFGNVRVSGMPGTGTTVNGVGEVIFFQTDFNTIPSNLLIFMRAGDDYVEIDGVAVQGSLRIVGAAGNDTIGIFDTTVDNDLVISTAANDDIVGLSRVVVNDQLRIVTGTGIDYVGIAPCVVVAGRQTLVTGAGNDILLLQGAYGDRTSVNVGAGNDAVYLAGYSNANNLRVLMAAGDDGLLNASTVVATANVYFNAGPGNDTRIIAPATSFAANEIGFETGMVDAAADSTPDTVAAVLSLFYVGRGGDPADLPC